MSNEKTPILNATERSPVVSPPPDNPDEQKLSNTPEIKSIDPNNSKNKILKVEEGTGVKHGETGKKYRRASMFEEAGNVKDIIPQPTEGGDISTLQAFFKEPALGTEDKGSSKKPLRRPKLVFENTFRLESKKPFVASRVQVIINETLEEMFFNLRYCSKTAGVTCSQVVEVLRNRILSLDYARYKVVVHLALGSMSRQGFCMAFKHLGDATRDSYAHGAFTNHHIFVVASVHAIYYD